MSRTPTHLAGAMFGTEPMASVFSGESFVRHMLAFEAALARAEARAGVIPEQAAEQIAAVCQVELFDVATIFQEAARSGTPVIPLTRLLTERIQGDGTKYVHWGATSQDAIDTALVLQMRDGLTLLDEGLLKLAAGCAALAERHRHTVMAGRTVMQQALPITFGLKAARWLAMVCRQTRALRDVQTQALVVQFGGAAGTLASLGDQGLSVSKEIAAELGLGEPDLPWHTERDRIAAVATTLGVLAGAMGKVAADILLLAQSEVGEVSEAAEPGRGGSSTMPQKRNPVDAMEAAAAARLAIGLVPVILSGMVQEHERAAGGWQAEWAALPDLFCYTAGALDRVRSAVAGLEVDAERMRANLTLTRGLIMAESLSMALARHLGREQAHQIVQTLSHRAISQGQDLQRAALADDRIRTVLSAGAIERALDPSAYLGSTNTFIDRALQSYREIEQEG
ncbi:MAG: 3-carboxy-cis,cis-muconate cycloisomerase [Dehalococcoidia bacterium]